MQYTMNGTYLIVKEKQQHKNNKSFIVVYYSVKSSTIHYNSLFSKNNWSCDDWVRSLFHFDDNVLRLNNSGTWFILERSKCKKMNFLFIMHPFHYSFFKLKFTKPYIPTKFSEWDVHMWIAVKIFCFSLEKTFCHSIEEWPLEEWLSCVGMLWYPE